MVVAVPVILATPGEWEKNQSIVWSGAGIWSALVILTGIFNVVSSQRISKYEFALKIAKTFGLDSKYIKKGSIKKSSLLAKRPPDMSLSNQKFIRLTNYIPLNLDQSIKELYYQFEEGRINDINRGFNINT